LGIKRPINFVAGVCKSYGAIKMMTIGKSDYQSHIGNHREQILEDGMQTFFGKEHQDSSHGRSNHIAGEKG